MRKAGREEDENQGFLRDPAALSTHTHTHTHMCTHTGKHTCTITHTRAVQKRGSFLSGAGVKNLPASAGDTSSFPGPGRLHGPQSS